MKMDWLKSKKSKILLLVSAVFLVVFAGAAILLNQSIQKTPLRPTGGTQFAKATVVKVISSDINTSEEGELQGNQVVELKITSGKYKGKQVEGTSPYANNMGAKCSPGLKVIVLTNEGQDGNPVATVYNYDRGMGLWLLIGLFVVVLCLIGGKKGFASVVGLLFTFVCIFALYLPLMYQGMSPFLAATITSVLITLVVMILIGGWSYKTLCAIIGTVAGVMIAGLIAGVFGKIGHISGLNTQDIETLAYVAQNSKLDVAGVLFSGVLIASLGAVMDVAMSISSTICEIHDNSPELPGRRLFQSGINVGKDMMGTMSNTLILAFAGSSVNLLVIIYSYDMPYLQYMNRYDIGIEILRSISGSLGVILTVPLVSLIATLFFTRKGKKEA